MELTTPFSINDNVLEFCKEIDSSSKPFFVEVIPWEESEYQDCFPNVENYIKKFGGKIQYGWTIWEIPEKFIEAEFHAVWVDENGKHIDITPKPDKEEKILFLKDSNKVFTGEPVNNIRKALLDKAEFRAMVIFGEKEFEKLSKYYGTNIPVPKSELIEIENLKQKIVYAEMQKDKLNGKIKIGRNEPCPCGSGIKYKKCCMNN